MFAQTCKPNNPKFNFFFRSHAYLREDQVIFSRWESLMDALCFFVWGHESQWVWKWYLKSKLFFSLTDPPCRLYSTKPKLWTVLGERIKQALPKQIVELSYARQWANSWNRLLLLNNYSETVDLLDLILLLLLL